MQTPSREAPLRVAIAGYGVVGQAVARRLASEPRFEIVSALVRKVAKPRPDAPAVALTDDIVAFMRSQPDVFVDTLSCVATSKKLLAESIQRGTPSATASKQMISDWLVDESELALGRPDKLAWSAAVGGSATMLELIARTPYINGLCGVLNGTVNFILTAIAAGASLQGSLARAREAGFSEEDASADLSGADAAAKLRILAYQAFGERRIEIATEPLDAAAAVRIAASGERWVQLSSLTRIDGLIRGRVSLTPLSALSGVDMPADEWNCLFLERATAGKVACIGRGAGGPATAEAIIADLYDLAALCRRVDPPAKRSMTG